MLFISNCHVTGIVFITLLKYSLCWDEPDPVVIKEYVYVNVSNGLLKGFATDTLIKPTKSAYIFKVSKV